MAELQRLLGDVDAGGRGVLAGWALARLSGANYLPDGRSDLVELIAPLGLSSTQVATALTDAKTVIGG